MAENNRENQYETLRMRVQSLAKDCGLKQAGIARKLGYNDQYLRGVLAGTRKSEPCLRRIDNLLQKAEPILSIRKQSK